MQKTKKSISEDLKKILKNISPQTLNLSDTQTRQITAAIKKAVEKAYEDASVNLPELELKLDSSGGSNAPDTKTVTSLKEFFNSLRQEIDDSTLLAAALQELRQSLSELMQMDTILTDIGKTAFLSSSQIRDLQDTAFDTADRYGRSATDYLASVQEMYSSGFDNAGQMAELSLLAQTAGNMSEELSRSYLTASDSAFRLKGNTEELGKILDGQTSIAKNSKTQLQDMASATMEAAASASQYGIQANELSALIAMASGSAGQSGTETGKALSYIFSSLNAADPLKNPIEQLEALAPAYQSAEDSVKRQSILEQFGGAEHADTLEHILDSWSSLDSMLRAYASGSGSAMEAASKSAESWEGSLNKLHNTWNKTINNLADSDAITAGIRLLDHLLSVITKITEHLDTAGTLGAFSGLAMNKMGIGERTMFQW